MTEQERWELVQKYADIITLNGEPAFISGYKHRFPLVIQKKTGLGCEFSWDAIRRVCEEKGGAFTS